MSVAERRKQLHQRRARESQGPELAQRFLGSATVPLEWVSAEDLPTVASPTWRRRFLNWTVVDVVGLRLMNEASVQVTFGSAVELGPIRLPGAAVAESLVEWLRKDGDSIAVASDTSEWRAVFDVESVTEPKLSVLVVGPDRLGLADAHPGSQPWVWDFVRPDLRPLVSALKKAVLEPEVLSSSRLSELSTTAHSLGITRLGVPPEPPRSQVELSAANPSLVSELKSALLFEVPDLQVLTPPA